VTAPGGSRPLRSPATATALVALAACCFGSIAILATVATRTGAPLLSVLAWRYLLGAATLTVLAGGVGALRAARGSYARLVVLGGGGQAAIAFTSLYALRFIPVASLVFLFYTYPAWIALFAALRGDEKVGALKVGAIALSLGGIALMVGAPTAAALHPAGVMLALASALMYALYVPFIGRLGGGAPSRVVAALVALGGCAAFVAVGLVVAVVPAAQRPELALTLSLTPGAWAAIATLAVVSTALAFVAFLTGLAVLGPVRTAIVSTIEPFWASLLGALVLHQPLGWPTLAGGALIAAAVLVLQLPQRGQPLARVTALDESRSQ
jgi:drug/metabolite transporter (DMT)-like permease